MKTLDISQTMKTFDGEQIKSGDENLTLKTVLLTYLSQAQSMNLSPEEQGKAYASGVLIGTTSKNTVTLEQTNYDVIKKMMDYGKIKQGQNEAHVYNLLIHQQARNMVDAATSTK